MRNEGDGEGLYLVVKATSAIKVVEECRVGLTLPKVQIANLKIVVNCELIHFSFQFFFQELEGNADVQ